MVSTWMWGQRWEPSSSLFIGRRWWWWKLASFSTLPLIPFLYLLLHQGPEGLGFILVRKVQSYLAVISSKGVEEGGGS